MNEKSTSLTRLARSSRITSNLHPQVHAEAAEERVVTMQIQIKVRALCVCVCYEVPSAITTLKD